jgi:hypothetical protein
MRNWKIAVILALLLFSVMAAAAPSGFTTSAPNAGDGVSDGSGFDPPTAPNGGGDAFGPAPNSGDGIPDGSGMTPPSGPVA